MVPELKDGGIRCWPLRRRHRRSDQQQSGTWEEAGGGGRRSSWQLPSTGSVGLAEKHRFAASRHPLPRYRPGADQHRAVRHPLVRAGLYRRHPARLAAMRAPSMRSRAAVGRAGAAELTDFDDFILWVTLGVVLGGRIGYVLFYNPAYFLEHPARDPAALEGRHVVPRRLARLRRAGHAVRAPAQNLDPVARRHHLRASRRSACSSAASPTSSTPNCGAGRPTCPGPWCSRAPARCRAIRASSTRRRSRAWCCSSCSRS